MLLLRRPSLLSLALGLVTLLFLLNRYRPFAIGKSYLYGETDPAKLYDHEHFSPGVAKPAGENYTRVLVMGRLAKEDVSWLEKELPGLPRKVYVVDDPPEKSGLPANKGHEAMVYLTYIIDHYDTLPDVVLFFHPHQVTWHNNVLLDINSATTIKLLSDAHVVRQGYFNSRCHLDPGCPTWLHVDQPRWKHDMVHKPEEPALTSQVFHDLFGAEVPIPDSLSQPCCAQFAVSGQRIRQRPRTDYIRYRDWILQTPLEDKTSGRMLEYSWQYIFTGKFSFCPSQHQCYCDGYGICFEGGDEGLKTWLTLLKSKEKIDRKRVDIWERGGKARESQEYKRLTHESGLLGKQLDEMRENALRRGFDPKIRASACGRQWREGDGF
jgi:hypothetical protein